MAKKPKARTKVTINSNKQRNRLLLVPLIALIIKLGIIARIQGFDWYAAGNGNLGSGLTALLDKLYQPPGAWYGADGENYLRSLLGLVNDGLFSKERNLHYWPAGYPILLWPIIEIFRGSFFAIVAILQSILYFIGCIFFVEELRRTRLVRFAFPTALILAINPTLNLNTIAIGYELPVASLILVSISCMMRHLRLQKTKVISVETFLASASFSIASFLQPRLIIIGFVALAAWGIAVFSPKSLIVFVLFSFLVVLIAPVTLMVRNLEANGFIAISTNLGVTMGIGAGPEATGGYNGKYNGVPCPEADLEKSPEKIDNAKVKCILIWYLHNPSSTLKLAWNKSLYFWSTWIGPAANGTMARNPWSMNHPFIERVKTEKGIYLAWRESGKPIPWNTVKYLSYVWILFSLLAMLKGFWFLWKSESVEKVMGLISLGVVIVNWLSSVATIGDHRFRIPTMGLSLFLQVVGFCSLFAKRRFPLVGSSAPITWAGLNWKSQRSSANLLPRIE